MTQGDLVAELQLLYRAAGRPSYRRITTEIRNNNDMPDTVSHETVGAILRGEVVPRWTKVECVVRQLTIMAVHHPDTDDEVRRFHRLWLDAGDSGQESDPAQEPEQPVEPVSPSSPADSVLPEVPGMTRPPSATPTGLVPGRSHGFTGRGDLLELIATRIGGSPWQPLVLHGLGGVGKTQLAVEYYYRHAEQYDLVWWITAEDLSQTTSALAALGERQDWPTSQNMAQTATAVLGKLEAGGLRWLLVFDNAGPPEDLQPLLPAAGGHVIVTTRDAAWLDVGRSVEIDVFNRRESIDFLRDRGDGITFDDADQLADRLGDLPLALEQVAAMQSATKTPVREYLRQLNEHALKLLSSVRPGSYTPSVATAFAHAADRIRRESSPAAQLLELLSCLGADPISVTLLRSASEEIPPPLGRILDQPAALADAIRLLRRYGLVKTLEDGQSLQVHRVVQTIVRDTLPDPARAQAYDNAQRLLVAANPGGPERPLTWDRYAQIGPHLRPARMLSSTGPRARKVALDLMRYLYLIGDYDGNRRLSEEALDIWEGPDRAVDDEQVFTCHLRLATALQALGRYGESDRLTDDALKRLSDHPDYGPDHPLTISMADGRAKLHRVFGRYTEALLIDQYRVARYRRIRGDDHRDTLEAMSNMAVSYRMLGDFATAYKIDDGLVTTRREILGEDHYLTQLSISNLSRDLYGLGRYADALAQQKSALAAPIEGLPVRHPFVLLARRTIVLALRKTGDVHAALEEGRQLYHICQGHFGSDHEQTLVATMTYANALCSAGQISRAWNLATEAIDRYRRRFGERNPLTLAAATNQSIILRAMGERQRARRVGEANYRSLQEILSPDHPFTLAAAVGVANDLVLAHEDENAKHLLTRTLDGFRRVCGEEHPDTLICAINLGLLLSDDDPAAGALFESSLELLRGAIGSEHPQAVAAAARQPGECDIEPPPT